MLDGFFFKLKFKNMETIIHEIFQEFQRQRIRVRWEIAV